MIQHEIQVRQHGCREASLIDFPGVALRRSNHDALRASIRNLGPAGAVELISKFNREIDPCRLGATLRSELRICKRHGCEVDRGLFGCVPVRSIDHCSFELQGFSVHIRLQFARRAVTVGVFRRNRSQPGQGPHLKLTPRVKITLDARTSCCVVPEKSWQRP